MKLIPFNDLPIQNKLLRMGLGAAAAALILAATSFLSYDLVTFQQTLASHLRAIADIVGYNSASAILFNDAATAERNLSALQSRTSVVGAALYTAKGDLFAHWARDNADLKFPSPPSYNQEVLRFDKGSVEIFHPVVIDKSFAGTVYIRSDLAERNQRLRRYSVIVLIVTALSFLLAALIAQRLGLRISRPILDLVGVAQRVSRDKDYSVRADVMSGGGEIGLLVKTFNEMLAQIQQSGIELLRANEVLEQKVIERTEELRRKEEELNQSRRLESVGRLAGGVAHDFNNLLTGIIGCSETLEEELPLDSDLVIEVKEIKRAAERASGLTRQLLAFGRKQIISPQSIEINAVIQQVGKLLRRLIGEDVEIIYELAPHLKKIHADPGQIEQVLMNIAVNARDAMPHGGKLIIRTGSLRIESESQPLELVQGEYVMLTLTDTGTGMSQDTQSHMFEPFFTTKGVGKGTGLGLATVYGIVKQNQGDIQVVSHPGIGTTFKIFLPVENTGESGGQGPEPHSNLQEEVPGGNETILVVEDETLVANHIARVLKRKGYNVIMAVNGTEALKALERINGSVNLVLTDVIMPEMNGRQMVEIMNRTWPNMKVLYMSGHPAEVIAQHGILQADISFIEKPFHTDQICQKIREVLDA